MRQAAVFWNGVLAGTLSEMSRSDYRFVYAPQYLMRADLPAISLNLPKRPEAYQSEHLFPFFFNMLSEGANRQVQSRWLQIDPNDHFGLLVATAQSDTIGAVTLKPTAKDATPA